MSVVAVPVARAPATCAAWAGSKLVLGKENGQVHILGEDGILERSFEICRTAVTAVAASTNLLAAAGHGHAVVWNLNTRKQIKKLDTRSAFALAIYDSTVVVASKYKLRWTDTRRGVDRLWTSSEKILALSVADGQAWMLIGVGSVVVLNLSTGQPARRFSLGDHGRWTSVWGIAAADSGAVALVGSTASVIHGKVVAVLPNVEAVTRLGTFLAVQQPSKVEIINPVSGKLVTVLDEQLKFIGGPFALRGGEVVDMRFSISVSDVVNTASSDLAEAVLEAEVAGLSGPEIFELEQRHAGDLLKAGDVLQACRILTTIETTSPPDGSADIGAELLSPIIEESENALGTEDRSDQVSLVSVQSLASHRSIRQHPLDPIVAYLALARRRLRLAGTPSKLVDTALFRAYMVQHSRLVLPLLRTPNAIEADLVVATLTRTNQWRELAAFWKSRGEHIKALQLLSDHNEAPETVVSYLESVQLNWQVLVKFAQGPIEAQPSLAKILFWDTNTYPSSDVLSFLSAVLNPPQILEYLRHRLATGDKTPEIHEALAVRLKGSELHELLTESRSYRPEQVLQLLEKDDVVNKALIYARMGNYVAAVDEYLAVNDFSGAEGYAMLSSNAMSHLFENLAGSSSPNLIAFLNRHPSELSLYLSKIPNELGANQIKQYLVETSKNVFNSTVHTELKAALWRSSLAITGADWVSEKRKSWTITSSTTCAKCHKRLGKAVIAVVDEEPVHYGCLSNSAGGLT